MAGVRMTCPDPSEKLLATLRRNPVLPKLPFPGLRAGPSPGPPLPVHGKPPVSAVPAHRARACACVLPPATQRTQPACGPPTLRPSGRAGGSGSSHWAHPTSDSEQVAVHL